MEGGELQFQCHHENCTRSFKRKDRLEIHLRTHTGERPFVCHIPGCSNSYARSQHLSRHIKRIHCFETRIEYKIQCPQCHVELANYDCLKLHEKRFHAISDEGKLYKCPEDGCHEVFRKRLQVVAHRETVHAHHLTDAARCHKCPHEGCSKSFLFPNVLKRHMKIHQGYPCDVDGCCEVLLTWTKLRKHKSMDHHASLVCEMCQSAFKTRDILVQHMKIHLSSKEPVVCPREGCDRTFLYKKNLSQHIRAFHQGRQVFIKKHKEGERVQKCQRFPKRNSAAARLCGLQDRSKAPLIDEPDSTQPEKCEQASCEMPEKSEPTSSETVITSCEKPSSVEQESDCPQMSDSCSEQKCLFRDAPCISVQALTG